MGLDGLSPNNIIAIPELATNEPMQIACPASFRQWRNFSTPDLPKLSLYPLRDAH
jgi:hypothetical protein